MLYKKLLILGLIIAAMAAGYQLQQYLKAKINPRLSLLHFLLFLVINILVVFFLVFVTGFIIIYFKDFFFKK